MRIVVQEWERVLLYRDGRYVETLGAGRHRRARWRRRAVFLTVRPRLVTLAGQEVLTGDGIAVKVSLLVQCAVVDARRWHETVQDPDAFVHAALQVALRDAVSVRTLEVLLAERAQLSAELSAAVAATGARVGLAVETVAIRDVMLPVELRRAAAEAVGARAHALAALERARGEVAALRALANAARMVSDNPALLQLRTLQALESAAGTTVWSSGALPGLPLPDVGAR